MLASFGLNDLKGFIMFGFFHSTSFLNVSTQLNSVFGICAQVVFIFF